jgi:integrase
MKNRFWLFKRGQTFYVEDSLTHKQESLHTKDQREARRLRDAKNEAIGNPTLSLAIGRAYLAAHDPHMAKRTWSEVMDELSSHGCEASRARCQREMKSKPFDMIRHKPLIETTGEDFMAVLRMGTTSTNHYLRRLHNLALGLGWLPWPILAPKVWPPITPGPKRAIVWEEHERIVSTEKNTERRLYYDLLWETGASQSDAAHLTADNIDWEASIICYDRQKTGETARLSIGPRLEQILRQLPAGGPLFPRLSKMKDTERAGEFRRRCRILGIKGVTLHSYRYAWAERARACGYPERFAQQALGHNSKAVHRAYARKAQVIVPALEEYEKLHVERRIIPARIQKGALRSVCG